MTAPVITVSPDTPLKDVARLLLQHRISAAPVVTEEGDLLGLVSEADLMPLEAVPARRILPLPRRPLPRTAGQAMSQPVVAVQSSDTLPHVARLMLDKRVKHVPVLEGDRVVGIISRRDILRVLARSDDEIRVELQELLDEEIQMLGRFTAEVSQGAVTLTGPDESSSRRLAELLARSVPGVVEVRFRNE